MEKMLLTVEEVRVAMGLSRPRVYQVVNREDFPKIRLGRRIMVPVRQLEEWIEKQAYGQN